MPNDRSQHEVEPLGVMISEDLRVLFAATMSNAAPAEYQPQARIRSIEEPLQVFNGEAAHRRDEEARSLIQRVSTRQEKNMHMTDVEQQEFKRQCDAYRDKHGASTLMTYFGHGDRWLCKRHAGQQAVLLRLGGNDELTVSAEDFNAQFVFYLLDESVHYFGSPEAKAAATVELEQQLAAIRLCIEADRPSAH